MNPIIITIFLSFLVGLFIFIQFLNRAETDSLRRIYVESINQYQDLNDLLDEIMEQD